MTLVLASGSPRRREILSMLGVSDFLVIPAKGEEIPPEGATPRETVKALAEAKAKEVAAQRPEEDLILAADTIVVSKGRIFGKPHSEEQAFSMLKELSGVSHQVFTGVALIRNGVVQTEAEETLVRFRPLSEEEIRAYIATGEPMDKAGAYGIQGKGSLLIEGIEGDYFNVVGLPVCLLGKMLKKQGVQVL